MILYGNSDRKEFKCKICNEVFDDGRKLGGHNSRKHKVKQNENKNVRF
jgi:hypothetical protein